MTSFSDRITRSRWAAANAQPSRAAQGARTVPSRILVAVSTPWASEKLYATVRDLAGRLQASVVVAHVARATETDETPEDIKQRGEQTLNILTGKLKEVSVPAEGLLLYGDDVAKAILNAAEAQHATMIIMGLSGKGIVSRLLAGDIPQQIMRSATVPVMMFPPDWSGTV
jgi:nucleotide-binding universal stress UspA family protein